MLRPAYKKAPLTVYRRTVSGTYRNPTHDFKSHLASFGTGHWNTNSFCSCDSYASGDTESDVTRYKKMRLIKSQAYCNRSEHISQTSSTKLFMYALVVYSTRLATFVCIRPRDMSTVVFVVLIGYGGRVLLVTQIFGVRNRLWVQT